MWMQVACVAFHTGDNGSDIAKHSDSAAPVRRCNGIAQSTVPSDLSVPIKERQRYLCIVCLDRYSLPAVYQGNERKVTQFIIIHFYQPSDKSQKWTQQMLYRTSKKDR